MALFSVQREQRSGRFSPDRELSDIYTELWELDENRLTPDKHYRINLQGGNRDYSYDSICTCTPDVKVFSTLLSVFYKPPFGN